MRIADGAEFGVLRSVFADHFLIEGEFARRKGDAASGDFRDLSVLFGLQRVPAGLIRIELFDIRSISERMRIVLLVSNRTIRNESNDRSFCRTDYRLPEKACSGSQSVCKGRGSHARDGAFMLQG